MVRTAFDSGINHRLELKAGYADEHSDETYLGLSESDFARNPYFRYAGAQRDRLTTRHSQWAATYVVNGGYRWNITSQAYYNYFFRNWYKLNDVRSGMTKAERRTIADVLADPEVNREYFDLLTGARNFSGEALMLRANHRAYHSRGVQSKGEWRGDALGGWLTAEIGLRYHVDDEDRFQQDDAFAMKDGRMQPFLPGLPGSNANRITEAHAWSGYALAKWTRGAWTLTAGARYEDVSLLKRDFTAADPRRSGKVRIETPNHAAAWLPGFGFNVKLTSQLSLLGGMHRGFAPPSATLYQKAENSTNFEGGARWSSRRLKVEAIGFFNNYRNMLGSDLLAAGGQGTLEQFNVGKAAVGGAEFLAQAQPRIGHVTFPLQLTYTYTHTEMRNEFSSDAWGDVHVGDEIPYIFRHAANAQLGAEYRGYELNVGLRYNGAMRTVPGQGAMPQKRDHSLALHRRRLGQSAPQSPRNAHNQRNQRDQCALSRLASSLRPTRRSPLRALWWSNLQLVSLYPASNDFNLSTSGHHRPCLRCNRRCHSRPSPNFGGRHGHCDRYAWTSSCRRTCSTDQHASAHCNQRGRSLYAQDFRSSLRQNAPCLPPWHARTPCSHHTSDTLRISWKKTREVSTK